MMLRDRYDPMDLFALVPTRSLAMEPVLAQLDRLLDDDVLFQRLKADLRRRAPFTATRGRLSTPVLEAVEGGLLSGYRILAAAGQDFPYVPDSLVAHEQRFGRPPRWLATDRGVYSAANEAKAPQARVRRLVIPYAGKAPPARVAQERSAWFRRALRFRAGLEGRISILSRRCGLDRCGDHGEAGLGRWVDWGIVTANLITMARTVTGQSARRIHRAA
jgi:hypothetical protein